MEFIFIIHLTSILDVMDMVNGKVSVRVMFWNLADSNS